MVELKQITFSYVSETEQLIGAGALPHKSGPGTLKDINLTVNDGEFVLLTGPSGCGKTTVLRLINGLIPNYYAGEVQGDVFIDGERLNDRELYDTARKVATVFQNPRSQFFNVDTTSELAFGSENMGVAKEEILHRIDDTVARFQIEKLMDRSIFKLSGGEKQKIACASIDVAKPEIILLDEPSANLDHQATASLRALIELWKRQGKTIIAAEHRISYLWDLVDRVVIMREGRIEKQLSADERDGLSGDDIIAHGLRSTKAESPEDISLPATEKHDEILFLKEFHFSYKRGMFEGGSKENDILRMDNLQLAAGKITAITGSNGVGKTTFLNCLCGLEKRCHGYIEYKGRRYNRRQRQDLVFMVMQDTNHQLFSDTLLDEVLISLPGAGDERGVKAAKEILKALDILEFAQRHPMSLSGGQKQRLAIACAIASGREILLFDEPTSGLDYIHMKQTCELLKMLREMGKTILVVTHDCELIRSCCERKIMLHRRTGCAT